MPKQPKQPKQKLSKEQIAQQMAQIAEADRFRKIIREELYPVLQTVGSIVEAKQLCEILKTVMMNKCNAYWVDKTVLDLALLEELTGEEDVKDREIYEGIIKALNGLSIVDAQKLLQGMGGALDGYTHKIAMGKMMNDIPVEEIITA